MTDNKVERIKEILEQTEWDGGLIIPDNLDSLVQQIVDLDKPQPPKFNNSLTVIADFLSGRHHIGYESAYSSAEDLPTYLKDAGYCIVSISEKLEDLLLTLEEKELLRLQWLTPNPDPHMARTLGELINQTAKAQLAKVLEELERRGKSEK